jgi:hypothetical protein
MVSIRLTNLEIDATTDPEKRKSLIIYKRKEEKESTKTGMENLTRTNQSLPFGKTFTRGKNDFTKTNFVYLKEDTGITPEYLESCKGEQLRSIYNIKKDGKLCVDDMPYDTYILEAVESKNFQTSAMIVTFGKITEERRVKKYIGLSPQTNSFIDIFVYSGTGDDDNSLVPDATVLIERNSSDTIFHDNDMAKIRLKQSDSHKGRFETTVVPGEYIIEVSKNGYEKVKKIVKLSPGDNKITIQMENQKEHKFKICVYNFDEKVFRVLENVQLKVSSGFNIFSCIMVPMIILKELLIRRVFIFMNQRQRKILLQSMPISRDTSQHRGHMSHLLRIKTKAAMVLLKRSTL